MTKTIHDYLAILKAEEKIASIKFSVVSVLSKFLGKVRKKIYYEKDAKKIYDDIEERWNTKLTSRFDACMTSGRIDSDIFQNICDYLKKSERYQNRLLNRGKCALTGLSTNSGCFDPYGIMPPGDVRALNYRNYKRNNQNKK